MKSRIIKKALLLICIGLLAFTGCAERELTSDSELNEAGETEYPICEYIVPDPNIDIVRKGYNDTVRELDIKFINGSMYRLAQVWGIDEKYNMDMDIAYYMQKLDYPYTEWENIQIPYLNYDDNNKSTDIRNGYIVLRIGNICDEGITFVAKGWDEAGGYLNSIGVMSEKGEFSLKTILPLPDEFDLFEYSLTTSSEEYCFYKRNSDDEMVLFDVANESISYHHGNYNIDRVVYDENDNVFVCYGYDKEKEKTYYIELDSNAPTQIGDSNETVDVFLKNSDSAIYGNNRYLWRKRDGEVECIFDFAERSYLLNYVKEITLLGDTILLYANLDSNDYILAIDLGDKYIENRKVITLEAPDGDKNLDYLISKYNRTNRNYYVKKNPVGSAADFDYDKYCDELKVLLATGGGSDILWYGFLDMKRLAEGGYILPVDTVCDDKQNYVTSALEYGMYNNISYGVPYSFYIMTAAYPQGYTEKDSISVDELIDLSESSEKTLLAKSLSGFDFIYYYVLADTDNKAYIDWEKGESHLEGKDFIRVLEFSQKYIPNENVSDERYADMCKNGKVISAYATLNGDDLSVLNYLDNTFGGSSAKLGYPKSGLGGNYVVSNMLFINANTSNAEGAYDFMKYAVSDAFQNSFVESSISRDSGLTGFSINRFVCEKQIDLIQKHSSEDIQYKMNGINYDSIIEDEDIDWLKGVITDARPLDSRLNEISDILSEELDAFYKGGRDSRETAEIIDSRIQIYLDENK